MNRLDLSQLSLSKVRRELCSRSYYRFFLEAWNVIEAHTPYIHNWHVEYLCDLLQKEVERIADGKPKGKDIIINIPPRSSKSWITTIALNAWAWINYPWIKFITSSYGAALATDHCRKTRLIIESDWYQRSWGNNFKIVADVNRLNEFENDHGGHRKAVGTGTGITGRGGDVVIADDPQDPDSAYSESERESVSRWWDETMFSRLNDQNVGLRLIVCQRLHHDDLVGHVQEKMPGKYRTIRIPGEINDPEYEPEPAALAKEYKKGLFFPERFGKETLADYRKSLGSAGYANQVGQKGSESKGVIFNRAWFQRRWQVLPGKFDEIIQSWDMAFKSNHDSSFVVGQVWGRVGALYFLVDQSREKLDFPGTVAAFEGTCVRHPKAAKKLVEDKANGPAVIATLQHKIGGIIGVPKTASKEEASHAVTPIWESGNVILPATSIAPWVEDFIEEHVKFPKAKYNDQVDCANQAINYFFSRPSSAVGMSTL